LRPLRHAAIDVRSRFGHRRSRSPASSSSVTKEAITIQSGNEGANTVALPGVGAPSIVAVDLGSALARVWASRQGSVSAPTGTSFGVAGSLVRRGRILDEERCIALLSDLARRFPEPITADGVVVACRPVQATMTEQYALRRVVTAVFAPSRLLLIDSVRAAAIGTGAAAGVRLVVDVGAQVTEIALLDHGRVAVARRVDMGTRDVSLGAPLDLPTSSRVASATFAARRASMISYRPRCPAACCWSVTALCTPACRVVSPVIWELQCGARSHRAPPRSTAPVSRPCPCCAIPLFEPGSTPLLDVSVSTREGTGP
jgi:hypothetical protein